MKFKGLNSDRYYNVNITKYLIKWDKAPSKNQQILQNFLRPSWQNDVVLAEFYIPLSRLRIDILNLSKKIAIEFSPDSHHQNFNKFFHKSPAKFLGMIKRDCAKMEWVEESGYKFVELRDEDIPMLSKEYLEEKGVII